MGKEGFVQISDKKKYIEENYPFENVPNLNDKKRCIHCDKEFYVKDYKVYRDRKGNEFIVCPDSPDCDGSIIDWVDVK